MAIKSQILISDSDVKLIELISTIYNVMLLAFYRAIDQSKTIFSLVNGFMDEYEDESGVDTTNSLNESYNSTDDYYSPSADSVDSYTKLLIHFNGTDGATSHTAETGQTVTFAGTAQLDTAQKKFGTASLMIDGNSDYVTIPDSDDWNFGSGDFTIECWVRFSNVSSNSVLISQYSGSGAFWYLIYAPGIPGFRLQAEDGIGGNVVVTNEITASTDTWYHIAVVRNGSAWKVYVNGSASSSTTSSFTMPNIAANLYIGALYTPIYYTNGWIDEVRISKGIARWTSNFTPPTNEYGTGVLNILLQSNAQVASSAPTSARIVIFEEDVDSITLNTDLKAYISRDNGTTFSQVTLTNEGYYTTSKNILAGLVDISSQPSGTNIKYKIESLNNKNLKIHGTGVNWA